MHPLLARIAGVMLCLVCGVGALNVLLVRKMTSVSPNEQTFFALKRAQPIVRPDDRWTLVAAGDIMLSRFVAAIIERESVDYPFDHIRGLTHGADISFANLENPVGVGTRIPYEGLQFRAEPETLVGLRNAGFDALSIANNHMSDTGRGGIAITQELLKNAGLNAFGAGENEVQARSPLMLHAGEKTIAFLAYGDPRFSNQVHFADAEYAGIALASAENFKKDISHAKTQADMVVVSLHAGIEYLEKPDDEQQALLYAAADAGADIVLGHHPHVIQPLERRGKSWIMSSLGNLVFDQMWSEETRLGMMLQFAIDETTIREIEAIPVQIHNHAQPQIATGKPQEEGLKRLDYPTKIGTVIQWLSAESGAVLSTRAMPLQAEDLHGFTMEKTFHDDLTINRRGETYVLSQGQLTMAEDDFPLWESPAAWWIQDAFTADIDGNRSRELVLSLWRDKTPARNYLYVYHFAQGRLKPLWQSLALDSPFCELQLADLNSDGTDEFIGIEGEYSEDARCTGKYVSIWQWKNGELVNQWKSDVGHYWNMRIEKSLLGNAVIVNGKAIEKE